MSILRVPLGILFLCGWAVAGADEPVFLKHTPANRDTFFYVADPLPHLKDALNSSAFARFRDTVNAAAPRPMPSVEEISDQLNSGSPYIPTEIAFTTTATEFGRIGKLFQSGLIVGLCTSAIYNDADEELEQLQKLLTKQIQSGSFSSTDVWLNFRSPVPAALIYGQAMGLSRQVQNFEFVEVDYSDGIGVQVAVSDYLANETLAQIFLKELGVVDEIGTPEAKELVEAVMKLKVSLHLRQHGNALHLTIGDDQAEKSAPARLAFDGWDTDDSSVILAGHYHTTELKNEVLAIRTLWHTWKDTKIGMSLSEWDTEHTLDDLDEIVTALELAGQEGQIVIQAKDGLQGTLTEIGVPAFETLSKSGVLNLLPEPSRFVSASTKLSLGQVFSNAVTQFESRLATNSLRYEMTGRTSQAQALNQASESYYSNFSEFRRLIKEDALKSFRPPFVILADADGHISELEISYRGSQGPNQLQMKDVRSPRFAMIGRIQTGQDVKKLMGQIWKELYNGINDDNFNFTPIVPDTTRIGQPAYFFSSDWQASLPKNLRISTVGLEPHYFLIDDQWLVFSSDPEFSKAILERSSKPNEHSQISNDLVAFGHAPMSEFSVMLQTVIDAFARVANDNDGVNLKGQEFEQLRMELQRAQEGRSSGFATFEMFSDILNIPDGVFWQSDIEDETCTTTFQVTFPGY